MGCPVLRLFFGASVKAARVETEAAECGCPVLLRTAAARGAWFWTLTLDPPPEAMTVGACTLASAKVCVGTFGRRRRL